MTGEETEQKKKEPRTLQELTGMASAIEDFFIDHKLRTEERQYIISLLQVSTSANLTMRAVTQPVPPELVERLLKDGKVKVVELRPTKSEHSDN